MKTYTSISLVRKVNKEVHDLQAELIKETRVQWSASKVINLAIIFAMDKGLTKESIKKIEKEYDQDGS